MDPMAAPRINDIVTAHKIQYVAVLTRVEKLVLSDFRRGFSDFVITRHPSETGNMTQPYLLLLR
jgi:hypothetical protein